MALPRNRIPRALTSGLFTPEYIERDVNLNDVIQETVLQAEVDHANTRVLNQVTTPITGKVPIPLTELEAEAADAHLANTQLRINAVRAKLGDTRAKVDAAIEAATNGRGLNFSIDIENKPTVRRAIKKLFGKKTDSISYQMYVEMLKAKQQLEKQEVNDYKSGKLFKKE